VDYCNRERYYQALGNATPNDGTTFSISISGMGGSGTVTASILAGVVSDIAGNYNNASTSSDNSVVYDISPPIVSSILRANANPTNMNSDGFVVTFSEPVTGVDGSDYILSMSGITGASITSSSGSGTTYTVKVSTGSGSGTLRLDVVDDDSIIDAGANPLGGTGLGNGNFNAGETYTIDKMAQSTDAGVIVNEVSNGSSGSKEWVELVVVGTNPTVDLSGWIIDDNNGDFDSFESGNGIASGHLRFANPLPACASGQSLASAPVGARIIIYNSDDVEGSLSSFPNDPCDSNGDGVYFLPVGSNPNNTDTIQRCADHPRISPSPVNPDYSGCVYSTPATSWIGMMLANTGDVIQIRRPDGIFYHGFSYGNLTVPPAPNFPSGDSSFNVSSSTGTNMAYQFQCGNYFSNTGGQFVRLNSGFADPGLANSAMNGEFIRSLELGTFNYTDLNDIENCRIEPEVSMSFSQSEVVAGHPAQLDITLNNPYNELDGYALDLLGVQFINNLPAGLLLSGPNPVSNSCGGVFSGANGDQSFSLSGVVLPTLQAPFPNNCTITVNVSAVASGLYTSELSAGAVSSTALGVSGGSNINSADASLLVTDSPLPANLPYTGFSPGKKTQLPIQPINKSYDNFGGLTLEIPRIDIQSSIVGVPITDIGWDLTWLGNQVGWLQGTVFPTWSGNSVITSHVWDAYNQPGPFAHLEQLRYGDRIIVHAWGQSYIYEVRSVDKYVRPDDTNSLNHEDYPWLTLITCKGYNEKLDKYDWRVVVRAVQVKVE